MNNIIKNILPATVAGLISAFILMMVFWGSFSIIKLELVNFPWHPEAEGLRLVGLVGFLGTVISYRSYIAQDKDDDEMTVPVYDANNSSHKNRHIDEE